jgi:hypothetical protein
MEGARNILAATFGGGIATGCLDKWRMWKAKRGLMTKAERNAGFWTDRKVLAAEIIVFGAWCGPPLLVIFVFAIVARIWP